MLMEPLKPVPLGIRKNTEPKQDREPNPLTGNEKSQRCYNFGCTNKELYSY